MFVFYCVMAMLAVSYAAASNVHAQGNFPTRPQSNLGSLRPQNAVAPNSPRAQAFFPRYPSGQQVGQLPNYPDPNGPPVSVRYAQLPGARTHSPPIQPPAAQPAPPSEVFGPAETIARVGDLHIFRGDLVGDANLILAPNLAKIPPEELAKVKDQINTERERLVKQMLQQAIQRKLMYAMFLRSIPPDKLEEAQANIAERVPEQFAERLDEMRAKLDTLQTSEYRNLARQSPQLFRIAFLMKQLKITTQRELDLFLHRNGSSLDKQHQAYIEDQLGRQAMFQEVGDQKGVSLDAMIEYYEKHVEDFRVPTRARWEQVTIRFDRFSTKFEAGEGIAKIGNELFYGRPFKAIAQRSSHGANAEEGGYQDWTQWGDFSVSREINKAVFSLPVGELSQIIEDAEGLHIVRVIEQQQEHVIPFIEAQVSIKKSIQGERRGKEIGEYLAKLQDQIPVWTIYDQPESEQLANPPADPNRFSR
ncbi:MAG: hypothetical protein CMJ64_27475 [Planctomycetaceae bacterium]|nr:hypothetical protein [Planctomycetaceae bacterium]